MGASCLWARAHVRTSRARGRRRRTPCLRRSSQTGQRANLSHWVVARSGSRGRFRLAAGALLILAGVAVLGWVAWQFWGTTWVSERRHAAIADELRQEWEVGQPVTTVDEGEVTALVRIPAFGDDYAVPLVEGTSDEALAAGFGHVEGTAQPGEVGNVAIAGHRVTHGEPLADMPDLQPGDQVLVETAEAVHTYVLDTGGDDLTVGFDETWVLGRLPTNPAGETQPRQRPGQRLLTLTTCAELFHTDDRLVAFGHLVSSVPR
nr:class E sortase [Nocardioides cavernae]